MPDTGRAALLFAMVAMFVAIAAARRGPQTPESNLPHEHFAAADHPVAALAWAKTHCNTALELRAGAHRTHAEVLVRVAAAFDQARSWRALNEVCQEAIAAARPAIALETRGVTAASASSASAKTAANER